MVPIELDRVTQSIGKVSTRHPSERLSDARRIGVEVSDVDGLLLGRPVDVFDAPRAGDGDEQGRQIAVVDRLIAADARELLFSTSNGKTLDVHLRLTTLR